jgi:hypothetical protein
MDGKSFVMGAYVFVISSVKHKFLGDAASIRELGFGNAVRQEVRCALGSYGEISADLSAERAQVLRQSRVLRKTGVCFVAG